MGIGKNVKALAKDRGLNLIELSKKKRSAIKYYLHVNEGRPEKRYNTHS